LLQNLFTVCNELYTHERINRNNKILKELDENEWNATTCIIQLKSAFFDVLASEAGLHWRFELHINYSVQNKLETHERINRNNKILKELGENEWNATTCITQLKSAFVDVLASKAGLHWRFEVHNNYSVRNELQSHERINRNNNILKELDENEWNSTTCIIQLKSTFVNVLASEAGLHWRFELHNNYSICNELQTHDRINRNNKKLKELDKMARIRCIIHSRKVMMISHHISF
jgi:beta-galactosidase beta subunit